MYEGGVGNNAGSKEAIHGGQEWKQNVEEMRMRKWDGSKAGLSF